MTAAMIPVPVPMTRLTPDLTPGACPHGYHDMHKSGSENRPLTLREALTARILADEELINY